ncbi:DNA polymerase III subunit delta [Roseovarius sp. EC-HK134]|uniref:DNA polymerase III subunit delta' n=1 Tax=unclassified Roseovarius TaxID=2614913 RepID=UPI0012534AD0|nr:MULTISPECIES: DNA polymerase III subunit delta' [unclassified Roseovarius]VVT23645.1 DNA polymerase III subunit delta [Roseovarius sp. EC-SD190]VVT23854.1 DNA polymerase III subunit delta [Roseovarius sp. EC-HK134]
MNDDGLLPEPDRVEGAPHPRETVQLVGQSAAEAEFLEAFNTGRLHHGWLITGPRGVGKATLAWRIARFLLATPLVQDEGLFGAPPPPATLDVAPDHPVARRLLALSDPGLFLLRRGPTDKGDRLAAEIRVSEVRKLGNFFALSAADGGRRVVIVDAADDLNTQAANAILKMLEEPPARTVLLLISHQPSGLLPTIRSRCRTLRLAPLGPQEMALALDQAGIAPEGDPAALAELSGGSVGAAVRLLNLGGLKLYAELVGLMESLPRLDRPRALRLAEAAATRGAEDRLDLLFSLTDLLLARLARTGATGQPPSAEAAAGEAAMLARLAPDAYQGRAWADCAETIGARARHGRAVNLDPASLVLDTVFRIQQTAGA